MTFPSYYFWRDIQGVCVGGGGGGEGGMCELGLLSHVGCYESGV